MANEIMTGDPRGFIKDVVRSSMKVLEFDKHLKKAGGHIRNNNKHEYNCSKTLNDKHYTEVIETILYPMITIEFISFENIDHSDAIIISLLLADISHPF